MSSEFGLLTDFPNRHHFYEHKNNAPHEAGQGLFAIAAIFSDFYKTYALANGYSQR
jgi:hypothetical protein